MADNLNSSNKKISAKSFLGGDKVEKYRQELIAEGKIPGTKLNATPEERRQAFNLYRQNKIDFKNFVEKVLKKKDSVSYAGISKPVGKTKSISGGGALVKTPSKSLTVIEKKSEEKETKSPFEGTFKVLNSILTTLKNQFKFDKKNREDERKEKEGQKRIKREEGLEGFKKGVSMVASATKKMLAPFQDIIDRIWRFIFFTLLGRAFTQLMDWLGDPKNKKKIDSLGRFLKDFFPAIAAAAALFLTPLGGFIRGTIKMLRFFIPQIVRFLAANPMLTGLALATIGGIAKIKESERMKPLTQKSQAEIDKTLQSKNAPWYQKLGASFAGQSLNAPGGPKNPIGLPTPGAMYAKGGMIPRFATGGMSFATGYEGIDTNTGQKVSGFGPDTQQIIAQPGEIVMNKKTVDAVGADHFLALNRQYGGPGANKPKMGRMYSTGGMIPGGPFIPRPILRLPGPMPGTTVPFGYDPFKGLQGGGSINKPKVANNVQSVVGYGPDEVKSFMRVYNLARTHGAKFPELQAAIAMKETGWLKKMYGNNAFNQRGTNSKFLNYKTLEDAVKHNIRLWDKHREGMTNFSDFKDPISAWNANASAYAPPGENDTEKYKADVAHMINQMKPIYSQTTKPKQKSRNIPKKNFLQSIFSIFGNKKQGGGHVKENTGMNIRGATADRQLAALQPGEYVLPVETVSTLGTSLIDRLVAMTDSNSNPAKLGKRSISRPQITPLRRGQSAMMSLPPITQSASGGGAGSAVAGSKIPTFSAISPSGSAERSTNASIYGIVG